jgi:DHA1 family tetracycline resistance protein-like MFS transporter
MRWAGIVGITMSVVAFCGYAVAGAPWLMYAAMIPGALSGLVGPAMNAIASGQIGSTQQGELQGGLSSMMSLTSIISPPMMTQVFGFYSGGGATIYFPGAPFLLAAVLSVFSLALFIKTTSNLVVATQP